MYIYTTAHNFNFTDNSSEPILPENPIRYSRTTTNPHVMFAPVYFLLVLLVFYVLDNLWRRFVKCMNNVMIHNHNKRMKKLREQKEKNRRSKFVIDMECKDCKDCAGNLMCKHKITRVL